MALKTAHDTELYEMGGGILSAAKWTAGSTTPPAVFTDLGNCPSLSFALDVVKVQHKSSRTDTLKKDKVKVTETGYTLKFTLDEISQANLAMLLMGTVDGLDIEAMTETTAEWAIKFVENNGEASEGRTWLWYKANVSPAGDTNLIDLEKFKELQFEAEGLADEDNHTAPESTLFKVTFTEITV